MKSTNKVTNIWCLSVKDLDPGQDCRNNSYKLEASIRGLSEAFKGRKENFDSIEKQLPEKYELLESKLKKNY